MTAPGFSAVISSAAVSKNPNYLWPSFRVHHCLNFSVYRSAFQNGEKFSVYQSAFQNGELHQQLNEWNFNLYFESISAIRNYYLYIQTAYAGQSADTPCLL